MIISMTAFGSATVHTADGSMISLELRSVNNRFLDLHFKLPDELRYAESFLREMISSEVKRGKVECRVSLLQVHTQRNLVLDTKALTNLIQLLGQAKLAMAEAQTPDLIKILQWPGVLKDEGHAIKASGPTRDEARSVVGSNHTIPYGQEELKAALLQALGSFQNNRFQEGARLAKVLQGYSRDIETIITGLKLNLPALVAQQAAKINSKIHEYLLQGYPIQLSAADQDRTQEPAYASLTGVAERVAHEISVAALRHDVAEEMSRLESHLTELKELIFEDSQHLSDKQKLNKSLPLGKRLDFLMQEMNREANTLGSKALSIEVTQAAMQLKLLIEQIREQVQNIE